MPAIPHARPTEAGAAGDYARLLADVIGPWLQPADGTAAAVDVLALGGAVAAAVAARAALTDEAFVDTATLLLAELEAEYGLAVRPDLSVATRRARLVAQVRAARAATPTAILSAIRALDPTATITENTPDTVPQPPTPGAADQPLPPVAGARRAVFRWAVRLAEAAWADDDLRAQVRALVAQMKPAHTAVAVHTNDPAVGFRVDDPLSLVDRDVLGS